MKGKEEEFDWWKEVWDKFCLEHWKAILLIDIFLIFILCLLQYYGIRLFPRDDLIEVNSLSIIFHYTNFMNFK